MEKNKALSLFSSVERDARAFWNDMRLMMTAEADAQADPYAWPHQEYTEEQIAKQAQLYRCAGYFAGQAIGWGA